MAAAPHPLQVPSLAPQPSPRPSPPEEHQQVAARGRGAHPRQRHRVGLNLTERQAHPVAHVCAGWEGRGADTGGGGWQELEHTPCCGSRAVPHHRTVHCSHHMACMVNNQPTHPSHPSRPACAPVMSSVFLKPCATFSVLNDTRRAVAPNQRRACARSGGMPHKVGSRDDGHAHHASMGQARAGRLHGSVLAQLARPHMHGSNQDGPAQVRGALPARH